MLLHGGTSSVYARGCPPEEERGWQVGILHPWERQRRLGACGCATGRWEPQRPRTSTWNITDKSWATYSIHEQAGQPPASPVLPSSPPRPPRPMRFRQRSTSAASKPPAVTVPPSRCRGHLAAGREGSEPVVMGLAPHEFALN